MPEQFILLLLFIIFAGTILFLWEKKLLNKKIKLITNIDSDTIELEHVGFSTTRSGTDFNWPVFKIKGINLLITKSWKFKNAQKGYQSNNVIPLRITLKQANQLIQKNELINDIKVGNIMIGEPQEFDLSCSRFE